MPPARRIATFLLVWLALLLGACRSELNHGLEERAANEIVVVLGANGIVADRVAGGGEAGWSVTVPRADYDRALSILTTAGLPRTRSPVRDAMTADSGLVPSAGAERLRHAALLAASLEDTLLAMDGVLDARVHLVVPAAPESRLAQVAPEPPRASVMLVVRSLDARPTDDAVRALALGAVEGLSAENVAVVVSQSPVTAIPAPDYAYLGPIRVAADSALTLRVVVFGLLAVCVGLAAALALVSLRLFRRPAP